MKPSLLYNNGQLLIVHYLPVMKDRQTESLSLSVGPQVCLEAKRINRRHERLDYVERRTRHWCILGNVTPAQYTQDMLDVVAIIRSAITIEAFRTFISTRIS